MTRCALCPMLCLYICILSQRASVENNDRNQRGRHTKRTIKDSTPHSSSHLTRLVSFTHIQKNSLGGILVFLHHSTFIDDVGWFCFAITGSLHQQHPHQMCIFDVYAPWYVGRDATTEKKHAWGLDVVPYHDSLASFSLNIYSDVCR
jgi:hypothetical protein